MTEEEAYRETLAKANLSRSLLYMCGFLTESENEKVHKRLMNLKRNLKNCNLWI